MVDFCEDRLETYWSVNSVGGPQFSTSIVVSSSGYEFSNQNWAESRQKYELGQRNIQRVEKDYLMAWFRNRKGRLQPFRFKDYTDFTATGQPLGTGNGSTTQFQLIKRYTADGENYDRTINKPVSGSVTVYIDGVEEVVTVNITTGIVTFSPAPGVGEVLTADFQFDVPVRFDVDTFNISVINETGAGIYQLDALPLVEVKL